MKKCPRCQTEKELTEFHKRKTTKDGLFGICKECNKKRVIEWQSKNRGTFNGYYRQPHVMRRRRAARYGLTVEQLSYLESKSGHKCHICMIGECEVIDHCHKTQNVRGVLCHKCNQALGLFGDSIASLQSAIKYLSGH